MINLYIVCSIVWAVILLITIIQISRRTDLTGIQKFGWISIIILAPVIGLLIYYFTATPKKLV